LVKAATKEEESTELVTNPHSILGPNSFESVLAEYGVTAATMTIPEPPTVLKQNFDQLCELTTPVFDTHGNQFQDVIGHTGPIMFLSKEAEYDGEKFKDYDGFYVYAVLHPMKGKCVVTIGRPADGDKPAIVRYFDTLTAGAWVQVASFKTSHDFRVFNPIPVQK
jgi:hypothetical protein